MESILKTLANLRFTWVAALSILAAIYLPLYIMLPPESAWVNDEGNRIAATRAFASGNGLAMNDPASKLDPELSGYPPPYFLKNAKGEVVSGYNPAFPALCAGPYWLCGIIGARAIPLLAGLVCAALGGFLAGALGAKDRAQGIATLATGI